MQSGNPSRRSISTLPFTFMSHSTTTTATYTLVKYSRSYPNSAQDANSEWQHYTKPTLKLILDVKKSLTTGELESVFLRIVWSMENSYAQDQSEVSFVSKFLRIHRVFYNPIT